MILLGQFAQVTLLILAIIIVGVSITYILYNRDRRKLEQKTTENQGINSDSINNQKESVDDITTESGEVEVEASGESQETKENETHIEDSEGANAQGSTRSEESSLGTSSHPKDKKPITETTSPKKKTKTSKKIYSHPYRFKRISPRDIKARFSNIGTKSVKNLSETDLQIFIDTIAKENRDNLVAPFSVYWGESILALTKHMNIGVSSATISNYFSGKLIGTNSIKLINNWINKHNKNKRIV